jgi:DNA-binding transcriptional regulator YiaG
MGVTRPTISFWENGKHPIPGWAVKMLELLEREASLHKSIKRASDIH